MQQKQQLPNFKKLLISISKNTPPPLSTTTVTTTVTTTTTTTTTINWFSCSTCARAFKRKSDLTRHEGSHLIIKPYSCTMCKKKTFYRKDSLHRHQQSCLKKKY